MTAQAPPVRYTLDDVRARTLKKRDAWWTVFLVDPIAIRLSLVVANRTSLTPNHLTVIALVFGMGAAASFWQGSYGWLIIGASLYHVSFMIDCMDGKIARLKGTGSVFGMWLDYIFDRLRVLTCSLALFTGQYRRAGGDADFLYLAIAVIFLDMLRYMDALQLFKLRHQMREKIRSARREVRIALGEPDVEEEPEPEELDDDEVDTRPGRFKPDLHEEFRSRFSWYPPIRDRLIRWRVRPHLFSGIEFQMFVFIIAPLSGAMKPVVLASAAMLFAFELVIIYKLWLSTRDLGRTLEKIRAQLPPGYVPPPPQRRTQPADVPERSVG